jgi:hypothetical protein
MLRRPAFVGGLLLFAGYVWAGITRMKRPVSEELMAFHRTEQMRRLKAFLLRTKKPEQVAGL